MVFIICPLLFFTSHIEVLRGTNDLIGYCDDSDLPKTDIVDQRKDSQKVVDVYQQALHTEIGSSTHSLLFNVLKKTSNMTAMK